MPLDPQLGQQLSDLGGFGLFLLTVVAVAAGLLRKWWVPGWLFAERTAERDALQAEVKQLTKTVGQLTLQLSRERRHRASDRLDE